MKKIHIPDDATATVTLDSEVLGIIQSLTEFDSLVSKDELVQILGESDGTLAHIADAAAEVNSAAGFNPDALNTLVDLGALCISKEQLIQLLKDFPYTLAFIADYAAKFNPRALNTLVNSGALNLSKDELIQILNRCPETLTRIALASKWGAPQALNALVDSGALNLSKDELMRVLKYSPDALKYIADVASDSPMALNVLADSGALNIGKDALIWILEKSPLTLELIAFAAVKGNPKALNALADSGALSVRKEVLLEISMYYPATFEFIAEAAAKGNPKALNALADSGALNISKNELMQVLEYYPDALECIAYAAEHENPKALNALADSGAFNLSKDELMQILEKSPYTLHRVAIAAASEYFNTPCAKNNPRALNELANSGALNISKEELMQVLDKSPYTLNSIACAGSNGSPKALNKLADSGALNISKNELIQIHEKSHDMLSNIVYSAILGNPKALNALADSSALNLSKEELIRFMNNDETNIFPELTQAALEGHYQAIDQLIPVFAELTREQFLEYVDPIIPYLVTLNTSLYKASLKYLPLTQVEFLFVLRSLRNIEIYEVAKNIKGIGSEYLLAETIRLAKMGEKQERRISLLLSAGKEANKAKVDVLSTYKYQITSKIHNGVETTSEFYASITALLGDKPKLVKNILLDLGDHYLRNNVLAILNHACYRRFADLAPLICYVFNNKMNQPAGRGYRINHPLGVEGRGYTFSIYEACFNTLKRYSDIMKVLISTKRLPFEIWVKICVEESMSLSYGCNLAIFSLKDKQWNLFTVNAHLMPGLATEKYWFGA